MPTSRFIALIVLVGLAAGISIWAGFAVSKSLAMEPVTWVIAGPALLVTWIVFRLGTWILRPRKPQDDADD